MISQIGSESNRMCNCWWYSSRVSTYQTEDPRSKSRLLWPPSQADEDLLTRTLEAKQRKFACDVVAEFNRGGLIRHHQLN